MILRDPPGGASSASYKNVKTMVEVDSKETADTLGNQFSDGLTLHTGLDATKCFGSGVIYRVRDRKQAL